MELQEFGNIVDQGEDDDGSDVHQGGPGSRNLKGLQFNKRMADSLQPHHHNRYILFNLLKREIFIILNMS